MSKYELSDKGINKYFNYSTSKLSINNISHTDIKNFFNNDYELKTITKDYHYILKTQESLSENIDIEQKELWLRRLNNVCSALKYCVKKLIKDDNNDIELGIFGSDSITSDIDIGVCYKKGTDINKNNLIKLSDVVKTFEDYFVDKNYTSLDIDVEMYADYFISPLNGQPFIQINKKIYDKSLTYIVSGMIKNYVQALYDKDNKFCDIRRIIKTIHNKNDCSNKSKIINIINNVNFNDYKKLISSFDELNQYNTSNINNILNKCKKKIPESKKILINYITKDYNEGRKMYYELLNKAHDIYCKYFDNIKNNILNDDNISIELNKNITHALIYRAESYVSLPTIYHIVYIIQAKVKDKNIHKLIGQYGYQMSMLEQLGYLFRYYIQYCINKKCKENFYIKKKKYIKRLIKSIKSLNSFEKKTKKQYKGKKSNKNKTKRKKDGKL